MTITLPNLCLVALVGPSGAGKSTFGRRHFKPTEVVSSDFCRGLVSDDENSLDATNDAFDVLYHVVGKRLARGLLTVVDATHVREEDRAQLVRVAREHDVLAVAVVLNTAEPVCHERNRGRPGRDFGPHVVRRQLQQLRRSLRGLPREGFRHVFVLDTPEQVEQAVVERVPLWTDKRHERGPFDVVGDVHGCYEELVALLTTLGYKVESRAAEPTLAPDAEPVPNPGTVLDPAQPADPAGAAARGVANQPTFEVTVTPPPGRRAVFLGDLVDRGPDSPSVLRLVMSMVRAGTALCVPGNHDVKLLRQLRGKDVKLTHGLAETVAQLATEPPTFLAEVERFIDSLVSHYVLDGGRLVVAHAGMKQAYVGRSSGRVREFALYGETTGETDEFGLPERLNWALDYRGPAAVVYGHTPVPQADWLNNTLNIDTGCAFGGALTALRWPERETVSVPARRQYAVPAKPFQAPPPAPALAAAADARTAQQQHDDVLDLADVVGKRVVATRLHQNVTVREENAIAALEVMSRFAADPRWLVYLPPTMSPVETSTEPNLLEHPAEAFAYFRHAGVARVVCQEKHMGCRAVVVVGTGPAAVARRFGVGPDEAAAGGVVLTRTGRRFFDDRQPDARRVEADLLARLRAALSAAGLWDRLATDWVVLDCELMPWSAKAQELLRDQYAAVGSAARGALAGAVDALRQAAERYGSDPALAAGGEALAPLLSRYAARQERADRYVAAYGRYCWPVRSVADLRLAPFHLLAAEGEAFVGRDHLWHMTTLAAVAEASAQAEGSAADEVPAVGGASPGGARAGGVVTATAHREVDLADPASVAAATDWWTALTAGGGEGMVVKPLDFVRRGPKGLVQPALKVRGPEYLRIIYGPEYDAPEHLARLRRRSVGAKRSLALREFALGVEALERFVRREPLRRVHECAFGVLALESEPVDPRL